MNSTPATGTPLRFTYPSYPGESAIYFVYAGACLLLIEFFADNSHLQVPLCPNQGKALVPLRLQPFLLLLP